MFRDEAVQAKHEHGGYGFRARSLCSRPGMTSGCDSAFSRRTAPEVCKLAPPPKEEGAGKTGCALHPRSRVQMCAEDAHEHTGEAEAVRPSLRNGSTAYFVLSPVRPELVCHRRSADTSAQLDTCHWSARTTRLCRTLDALFVKSASASTAPRPNVSDDGQRPLSRDGMRRLSR